MDITSSKHFKKLIGYAEQLLQDEHEKIEELLQKLT